MRLVFLSIALFASSISNGHALSRVPICETLQAAIGSSKYDLFLEDWVSEAITERELVAKFHDNVLQCRGVLEYGIFGPSYADFLDRHLAEELVPAFATEMRAYFVRLDEAEAARIEEEKAKEEKRKREVRKAEAERRWREEEPVRRKKAAEAKLRQEEEQRLTQARREEFMANLSAACRSAIISLEKFGAEEEQNEEKLNAIQTAVVLGDKKVVCEIVSTLGAEITAFRSQLLSCDDVQVVEALTVSGLPLLRLGESLQQAEAEVGCGWSGFFRELWE